MERIMSPRHNTNFLRVNIPLRQGDDWQRRPSLGLPHAKRFWGAGTWGWGRPRRTCWVQWAGYWAPRPHGWQEHHHCQGTLQVSSWCKTIGPLFLHHGCVQTFYGVQIACLSLELLNQHKLPPYPAKSVVKAGASKNMQCIKLMRFVDWSGKVEWCS